MLFYSMTDNWFFWKLWASLMAQLVKDLPAMQETAVWFLGRSTGDGIGYALQYSWVSLVAQLLKNLPAMQETWVQSLCWEDPLEKGKATHSSILAWRITWTIHGLKRVGPGWATFTLVLLRLLALSLGKTDTLTRKSHYLGLIMS